MTHLAIRYPDIRVQLGRGSGNAFAVLGACQHAARQAGIPDEEIEQFCAEASSGDYSHLLATCHRWFDCV